METRWRPLPEHLCLASRRSAPPPPVSEHSPSGMFHGYFHFCQARKQDARWNEACGLAPCGRQEGEKSCELAEAKHPGEVT